VDEDLKASRLQPERVVLLVVDEAHRSTGKYAYATTVAAILAVNPFVRVIGLSATPGKDVNQVQKVINSLRIAKIERRGNDHPSITPYHHDKMEERFCCDLATAPQLQRVRAMMVEKIKMVLGRLRQQYNLSIAIQADKLTSYNVRTHIQQLPSKRGVDERAVKPVLYKLQALAHERQMLEDYGVEALCGGNSMRAEGGDGDDGSDEEDGGGAKGKKKEAGSGFNTLEDLMRYIGAEDDNAEAQALRAAAHPKAQKLRELLLTHFQRRAHLGQAGRSKVIIFSASRAAVESIVAFLRAEQRTFADMGCEDASCGQTGRLLKPHAFVGQAASKTSKGLKQSEQRRVIEELKAGKFNILVATSIAEEGLDIGEVRGEARGGERAGGAGQQLDESIHGMTLTSPHHPHHTQPKHIGGPLRALRRGDLLPPQDAARRAHGPPPPREGRAAVPPHGQEEAGQGRGGGAPHHPRHGGHGGPRRRRRLGAEARQDAAAGDGEPPHAA
jgi:ATP-dependent DNA helicase MPH1